MLLVILAVLVDVWVPSQLVNVEQIDEDAVVFVSLWADIALHWGGWLAGLFDAPLSGFLWGHGRDRLSFSKLEVKLAVGDCS